MKLNLLTAAAILSLGGSAYAGFAPIPLDPSSYNQDPVIEKTAPRTLNEVVTVTPDQGTNKNANTWYEVGYVTNSTGLPAHGSLVSTNNHTFQMPPDYHTNCVLFVGHHLSSWTPIVGSGTFTLTTPAPFAALSFLSSSGNGPCLIKYVVHFADSSSESGTFSSTDWFNNGGVNQVFDARGLVSMNGVINNQSASHGSAFYSDVALANATANITSIDFYWYGQNAGQDPWSNGRTCIFAMSGSTDGITYSPITVTGYNADVVVEADGPKTIGAGPASVTGTLTNDNTYCSFTMDGGLSKVNWTLHEQGYYTACTNSGLPAPSSTITSATRPDISYTLPPSYSTNCAVCLSSNIPTAQIRFANPTAAGSLSFLGSGGNNGTRLNIRAEIQFQDGTSETNWIAMQDWFNRGDPWAFICFGQVWPAARAVRYTPDQFASPFMTSQPAGTQPLGFQPFARDPRTGGAYNPTILNIRLFDLIIPVANSSGLITGVNLVTTNTGSWNATACIFAVSGSSGAPPVITQPASLVLDSTTGVTNATTGGAVANDVRLTKGYQGINNFVLYVSNVLGNSISYQWKKAPRGGGYRDIYNSFDYSTFANVVNGGNISGATSNFLVISNATLADSADYLVVASNPYGSYTSYVATVMVLTTNSSVLVGTGLGDIATKWSSDGTSGNGQETFTSAIDQKAQKWLSTGLGAFGFDGLVIPAATVPFVGPVGFSVIPVNGASIVNSIRFYCANDSSGRDPRDYLLEGSNDGAAWATITSGQLLGTLMLPTARGGTGSTPLNPMTQPVLEVDFANATAYKQYRITITNNVEPVVAPLMQVAEIQLLGTLEPNPPVWVRQPEPNVTVFAGTSPTWGVLAGGYPAPRFQWYTNGTAVPNATNSTYTLSGAQLANSGMQVYVIAQNNAGNITSSTSTLTVIPAPTQPYPAAVLTNGGPMGYWRLDEGPNDGLGNNGVITHDYAGGHNGYYSNVVIGVDGYNTNADANTAGRFGDVTADSYVENIENIDFARGTNTTGASFSVEAWVYGANQTVTAAIVTKGYNGTLNAGTGTGTEQFVLDVTGTSSRFRFMVRDFYGNGHPAQSTAVPYDPVSLLPTWHHLVGVCDQPNGKILLYVDGVLAATGSIDPGVGILSQTLPMTIGARKSSQAAEYDNQWTGVIDDVALYPTALSASQVLAHFYAAQYPPIILLQPTNTTTAENVPVTFYSSAYGSGTLSYQWYLSDGFNPTTPVSGQTSSNLTFTTSAAQSGSYYQLVVANAYGACTGAVAQLTVVSGVPTLLTDLPASDTFYVGHIIKLHVVAGGTAPFTYQWRKNGVAIPNDYRTSGAQSDTLIIAYAATTDSGTYDVIINNAQGQGQSRADAVTVVSLPSGSTFFNATAPSDWSVQGTAPLLLTNNSFQLTDGNLGSIVRSAFLTAKQNIAAFNATFIYQDATGAGGADGITFCIQNQSATALGGGGGSLAYSGITPSFALAINIYNPQTRGIAFLTNGVIATPYMSLLPNVGIGDNTNAVRVSLSYNGTVLAASFTDLVTSGTYTTNITVDIPGIVGGSTAWVGFTGADGAVMSTQIVSWSMLITPIALNSQMVGNNLVFSWPASAGAILQTTTSLSNSTVWSSDTTDTLQVVGDQVRVTVSPSGASRFFRLQLFQ